MHKKLFAIDTPLKAGNKQLEQIKSIEVEEPVYTVLNSYKELVKKQRDAIKDLEKYKARELDAFAIGDAISDGICLVDAKGIVIAINKGYTEITGITEAEIVGKHLQYLLDNGYFNSAVSLMVLEQKKKISLLSTINRVNKKVLITGSPFFDHKGEVAQVLTVMRDLTELIKLKEKLEATEKESERYLNELNYLRDKQFRQAGLIGENVEILKMKELIKYVANTDATILITGETGCGKEVVAREIFNKSGRKDGPYIKVNCAAIPDTLIESELFGYEKGAFTGALGKEKLGMFQMADKGTILLDEISEIPLNLQSKLLRVLQEKEIVRVGGTKSIKLDVRVIAATNQDLSDMVQKGRFRADLYYRLNVVPIKIPALRQRTDDIPLLAYYFLEKFNRKYGKEKKFENMAVQALGEYHWPGNVRELENVLERLVVIDDDKSITNGKINSIMGKSKITADVPKAQTLREAVEALEKEMIEAAVKKYGSTHKAALALGVTQPTVCRKAKSLGIRLGNAKMN